MHEDDTLPPPVLSRANRWLRRYEKRLAIAGIVLLLIILAAGCAASPVSLLDKVQASVNHRPPCRSDRAGACHQLYPTRAALAHAYELECTGYVMAKAYALIDAGYTPERLAIGISKDGRHAVLVVDRIFVLDNLQPDVRWAAEYSLTYVPIRAM